MPDIVSALYQQFDPVGALPADRTDLYVDWQRQLGLEDAKERLVSSFAFGGDQYVWQLLTGHRGVGKSTELVRVQARLESPDRDRRYFVSLLRGEQWLDLDDLGAEDVAFQMIRQLVTDLIKRGGMSFMRDEVTGWADRIWKWLGTAGIQVGPDWLNISLTLKDFPGRRDEFRELLRGQLTSLFDKVNEDLLRPARQYLADAGYTGGIVLIVDDLDKIVPRSLNDGRGITNQEQLFVHEGRLLRSLNCHAVYVIPIELAYSHAQQELVQRFGSAVTHLPAIALRGHDGSRQPQAVAAMREIFARRVVAAGAVPQSLFSDESLLERTLNSTGGHVRSLFVAMRELLLAAPRTLPINQETMETTFRRLRRDMMRALRPADREVLSAVAANGDEVADPVFFDLLRSGYVLAYQDDDRDWYAPHPWLGIQAGP